MRVYTAFLEIAIDDDEKRAANAKVWAALAKLYDYLKTPLSNPRDQTQRDEKAEKAQDLAVDYVGNFSSAVGEELCTLYMHHGMCHIPDMIRHVPLNISDMSQQWFEALLKQGKTGAKLFSNKRLRDEKQDKGRNYQILGKERERVRMKRDVPMPLTRNERRHLAGYEGQKRITAQTVDRAMRRG